MAVNSKSTAHPTDCLPSSALSRASRLGGSEKIMSWEKPNHHSAFGTPQLTFRFTSQNTFHQFLIAMLGAPGFEIRFEPKFKPVAAVMAMPLTAAQTTAVPVDHPSIRWLCPSRAQVAALVVAKAPELLCPKDREEPSDPSVLRPDTMVGNLCNHCIGWMVDAFNEYNCIQVVGNGALQLLKHQLDFSADGSHVRSGAAEDSELDVVADDLLLVLSRSKHTVKKPGLYGGDIIWEEH
ncbi:hypothetical protein B0H10DRAFT_1960749 [Mycena sp. CBHHK59/15]|nr:hypothetical protein B0H10DRAFT_1960749 [Mycena sp. CBHHK59/15]